MGVYHICGLVACHSRPVTLHPTAVHYISGTLTQLCHFPLYTSIVVGFQLRLPKEFNAWFAISVVLLFVMCYIFAANFCQNLKLCYSCQPHMLAPRQRYINNGWFTVVDLGKLE